MSQIPLSKLKEIILDEYRQLTEGVELFTKDNIKKYEKNIIKIFNKVIPYADGIGIGVSGESIIGKFSLDKKNTWPNGYIENSRCGMFTLHNDGELRIEILSWGTYNQRKKVPKFRKSTVKSVEQAVAKSLKYLKLLTNKKYSLDVLPEGKLSEKIKPKQKISKKEWSKIKKFNKHIGQDGTHYVTQLDKRLGTILVPVIVEGKLTEGGARIFGRQKHWTVKKKFKFDTTTGDYKGTGQHYGGHGRGSQELQKAVMKTIVAEPGNPNNPNQIANFPGGLFYIDNKKKKAYYMSTKNLKVKARDIEPRFEKITDFTLWKNWKPYKDTR